MFSPTQFPSGQPLHEDNLLAFFYFFLLICPFALTTFSILTFYHFVFFKHGVVSLSAFSWYNFTFKCLIFFSHIITSITIKYTVSV